MPISLTIPLVKIDEEKRLIVARAAHEIVDRSNEILDYATAKPAFDEWSKSFETATGGLSKGNLRVMHNPKIVAGKVVEIEFNDADKAIDVVCKVVDDNEWKKVVEGVYTGLSVGGSYSKKWTDPATGSTRYTPKVAEISLVDRPCIPTATIAELHKADGSIEEVRLTGRVRTFGEISAPRTFGEIETPRTFGELAKFDESKVSRDDDGRFTNRAGLIGASAGLGLGLGAGLGTMFSSRRPNPIAPAVGFAAGIGGAIAGGALGERLGERMGQKKNIDPNNASIMDNVASSAAILGSGAAAGAAAYGANRLYDGLTSGRSLRDMTMGARKAVAPASADPMHAERKAIMEFLSPEGKSLLRQIDQNAKDMRSWRNDKFDRDTLKYGKMDLEARFAKEWNKAQAAYENSPRFSGSRGFKMNVERPSFRRGIVPSGPLVSHPVSVPKAAVDAMTSRKVGRLAAMLRRFR